MLYLNCSHTDGVNAAWLFNIARREGRSIVSINRICSVANYPSGQLGHEAHLDTTGVRHKELLLDISMYMCVCVCVCVCARERERETYLVSELSTSVLLRRQLRG